MGSIKIISYSHYYILEINSIFLAFGKAHLQLLTKKRVDFLKGKCIHEYGRKKTNSNLSDNTALQHCIARKLVCTVTTIACL